MRTYRFFSNQPLVVGDNLSLRGENFHYLRDVLRFKVEDSLTVFNGQGGEFLATVIQITKKEIWIHLEKFLAREVESPLKINFGQVISKREHMDYTIQKAAELGVSVLTPLWSERSEVILEGVSLIKKIERWQNIAIHASEQSGRNKIMKINPVRNLLDFATRGSLFFDLNAKQSWKNLQIDQEITLLVGPEGGFSPLEITQLELLGARGIRLGPRVLRTETAGSVAIAIIQALWGDMQ